MRQAPIPERDGRFNLWDFGGQDIYHGVHALFLRSRAIFLIVWTPDADDSESLSPCALNASGGQEQVALGLDHLPSHDHGYGKGPAEPNGGKGHRHDIKNLSFGRCHTADGNSFAVTTPDPDVAKTECQTTGIQWDGMIEPQGQNKPHANIPPFHWLYFIMKT